jgi:hypothetical protein
LSDGYGTYARRCSISWPEPSYTYRDGYQQCGWDDQDARPLEVIARVLDRSAVLCFQLIRVIVDLSGVTLCGEGRLSDGHKRQQECYAETDCNRYFVLKLKIGNILTGCALKVL